MFNLLRRCSADFQSNCLILHFPQRCTRVLTSPHPCHHNIFSFLFLMIPTIEGMQWYLIMVLICIYLMTDASWLLFMYRLAIPVHSLEKCIYIYILIELFVFLLSCKHPLRILEKSHFSDTWFTTVFSFSMCFRLLFFIVFFKVQKFLILMKPNLSFLVCAFESMSKKHCLNTRPQNFTLVSF